MLVDLKKDGRTRESSFGKANTIQLHMLCVGFYKRKHVNSGEDESLTLTLDGRPGKHNSRAPAMKRTRKLYPCVLNASKGFFSLESSSKE